VGRQFAGKPSVLESAPMGWIPFRNRRTDPKYGPRMTVMMKVDYPQIAPMNAD
jgi:hypothetical protein